MARYQLLRPSPVRVIPRRVRRQDAMVTTMPVTGAVEEEEEVEEVEEGPESPDSPFSSPSTIGGQSESEDSDSDDDEEPPSPVESGTSNRPVQTLGPDPATAPTLPTSAAEGNASTTSVPTFTITSQKDDPLLPLITRTTLATITRPATTSFTVDVTQSDRQKQSSPTASVPAPPPPPLSTAESELSGESDVPQRLPQREQEPIMTKEAMVAAIILGVLGALALLVAAVVFIKRRKRRSNSSHVPLPDEPFYPSNTNPLVAPETAHVGEASSIFARLNGSGSDGRGGHLTRSTERSNTLFGPGPYARPETVSTDRNNSRMAPRTPNPFADPPLNKAYDVLNNRPRSTTLTDRGSWRENPFKNPESERFDPFGELKEKARRERLRYLEDAKREAELQRQMEQKEAMGLRPNDLPWGVDNGYR